VPISAEEVKPGVMRAARVLMVAHETFPKDVRILKEARVLQAGGWEVDLIALRRPGEPFRETVEGIRVWRLPLGKERGGPVRYVVEYLLSALFSTALAAAQHLRRRYDLIYIHNIPNMLAIVGLVPKCLGARLVLDMHEPMPEFFCYKFGASPGGLLDRVMRLEERFSVALANLVVVISPRMQHTIARRTHAEDRTIALPNTLDPIHLADALPTLVMAPVLIYHGTLTKLYGLRTLLDAFSQVKALLPEVRLFIYGEGPERPHLESQSQRLNLTAEVRFMGHVSHSAVLKALKESHLAIVPIEKSEYADMALSDKISECVAHGIPVVTTDLVTLRDFYGPSGLSYCASGNSSELARTILHLLRNPEVLETQRKHAIERLNKQGWGRSAAAWFVRLRDILEQ
jgi:glycosyltransferase involved in cell wall biosynthesis